MTGGADVLDGCIALGMYIHRLTRELQQEEQGKCCAGQQQAEILFARLCTLQTNGSMHFLIQMSNERRMPYG